MSGPRLDGMWLDSIPETLRETAESAVKAAFGHTSIKSFEPVSGGASGALTYKAEVNGRFYLLRLETRRGPMRNPHQYVCMRIAAEAGIAPPLRYADDLAGAAIVDFVIQRSFEEYPGGPAGLAAAVGKLAATLQSADPFPVLIDFRVLIDRMLGYLKPAFAPGLPDPHLAGFDRIRQAYPWSAAAHVSSHNDPNPGNILFDGKRLWLIDWETAYRNEPLTDIAILTHNFGATPELEDLLLQSWLGCPPDRPLRARLTLMRQLTRLYYAGILLCASVAASAPVTDLSAPTPAEFRDLVASGQLKAGAPETGFVLGKVFLAGFIDSLRTSEFEDALVAASRG